MDPKRTCPEEIESDKLYIEEKKKFKSENPGRSKRWIDGTLFRGFQMKDHDPKKCWWCKTFKK